MRKILVVDLSLKYGGADVRVGQMAKLLGEDFEVTVAVIEGSEAHAQLARQGARIWPIARGRKDPRLIWDLMRCIRGIQADVVDAHNPQSILWGMLAGLICGTPIRIATIHSIYEITEARRFGRFMFGELNRLINWTATHVIAVSEVVARHISERGICGSKIHIVQNGVPAELSARNRDAPGRSRIAVVGRLVAVKGHSVLLNALAQLVSLPRGFECLIIGDGPERERLHAETRRLGLEESVHFVGFREDVTDLVSQCDVFCMPSHAEALPFAALEAAALAVPIVASKVGGLEQHFHHCETALLVPPNDSIALANALQWCFENFDSASRIGRQAQKMVAEQYSLNQTLEATRALFLVDPNPGKPRAGHPYFSQNVR